MQLPLVILALQTSGTLAVDQAERYLASCKSRNQLYSVTCYQSGPSTPISLPATADISKLAYERAVLALSDFPDAAVSVGLQSNMLKFVTGRRIVTVRMVAAALVCRNDESNPAFAVATDDSPGGAAHLVAQALGEWRKKIPIKPSGTHLMQRVIKKAAGFPS